MKPFRVRPALRGDGAAAPAIRGEREILTRHARGFLDLCNQQRPADRRTERGDQQAVIAARQHAGDGARGVTADAVGDQPFARAGRGEIAGDFAAQIHCQVR